MPLHRTSCALGPEIPRLVLDTNAVLDWLVFGNPASLIFTSAIVSGRVHWIVNDAVRDELTHVIGRGVVERWAPDLSQLWQAWERYSTSTHLPPANPAPCHPQCSDTDDQKFIDLALDTGARWLITRDRAVLKLARRAAKLNLSIVTPERFVIVGAETRYPSFCEFSGSSKP